MEMEIAFGGGKKVNALFNGFQVCTDQPKDEGGDGSAPEPYSLFLASIGTCAGIYVLGFCQSRGIDASTIKMRALYSKNEKSKLMEEARIIIEVTDAFPQKYHPALARVVQQCTVKRSIANPPEFVVEIAKG